MIDDVLAALPDAKKTPNGWQARCPAHQDDRASLAVAVGEDGRVIVNCFAGCSFDEIVIASKLPKTAFFSTTSAVPRETGKRSASKAPAGEIETVYDYTDELGELLFQAVRFKPKPNGKKDFRQRQPDPKNPNRWLWNLTGARRVLYRLPELVSANPERTVVIVEGEKDVDRLVALGFITTCNPMGAGKWREEFSESLRKRPVVIIPDNDKVGVDHAIFVAESLLKVQAAVKIVTLPDLPPGGDVSDWLDAGGTIEDLRNLASAARVYTPPDPENTIDALASRFINRLEPVWRRGCQAIYSFSLGLEIPLAQLWTHLSPEEIAAVTRTAEGREMIRNNRAPSFRQRLSTLRDAVQLAAGNTLAGLPDLPDAPVNHTLNVIDLESTITAWLLRDRTCRQDNGNPISLTYYGWAYICKSDEGWFRCYNTGVFGRKNAQADHPEVAVQGDLLVEQIKYESKRTLARDLRQAKLADTDSTIRVDGRVCRAWTIDSALIGRAAGQIIRDTE